MKKFYYKAIKDQKELVSGYIEANEKSEAADKIRQLGFLPSAIYEENLRNQKTVKDNKPLIKLSRGDLILFTEQLETYTESGLSILYALENISKHSHKKNIASFAEALSSKIKKGETFAEAIDSYKEVLGETYPALCHAGEYSGKFAATLGYLKILLRKQDDLKQKFIRVTIYPTILIAAIIVMFFVFGGFVFPRMIAFIGVSSEIPRLALWITAAVKGIFTYWWAIALAVGYFIYGWFNLFDKKKLKIKLDNALAKIPLIKDCVKYVSMTNYMTVLSLAYEAGIPILEAMALAQGTITNKALRQKVEQATLYVKKGESLSSAYYKSDAIPQEFIPVITTGEETGKLGNMFRDISIAISKTLDNAIEIASRAFEPAIIAVIGLFVGIIVFVIIKVYIANLMSIF